MFCFSPSGVVGLAGPIFFSTIFYVFLPVYFFGPSFIFSDRLFLQQSRLSQPSFAFCFVLLRDVVVVVVLSKRLPGILDGLRMDGTYRLFSPFLHARRQIRDHVLFVHTPIKRIDVGGSDELVRVQLEKAPKQARHCTYGSSTKIRGVTRVVRGRSQY